MEIMRQPGSLLVVNQHDKVTDTAKQNLTQIDARVSFRLSRYSRLTFSAFICKRVSWLIRSSNNHTL